MARGNGPGNAPAVDANQANMVARSVILDRAINMWQSIYSSTFASPGIPGAVINVPIRNVGLIKRLLVRMDFTVARSAAETQTRTDFGPANALSQIVFTDLSNQTRINTTGWHMHFLATARRQMAFGAAFVNDSPIDIASNFDVISAPASFTTGSQTVRMYYEIPISYSDYDLRGAIYASVVNATMNLQLIINPNFFVASTGNPGQAVYISDGADLGAISALTVTVYQNYLDQIPMSDKGPILPLLDLSTAYLLNNSVATGLAQTIDNPIPYANFRNFLSTFAIYDNAGVYNPGTDLNYFSIQSANYTNIIKIDPITSALLTREIINDDFPSAVYYFDHRQKPISTVQYGNMQLIFNPSSVTSSASQMLVAWEALALINQITQAGSLYGT